MRIITIFCIMLTLQACGKDKGPSRGLGSLDVSALCVSSEVSGDTHYRCSNTDQTRRYGAPAACTSYLGSTQDTGITFRFLSEGTNISAVFWGCSPEKECLYAYHEPVDANDTFREEYYCLKY